MIPETKVRPVTKDPKEVADLRVHTESREKQEHRYEIIELLSVSAFCVFVR